MKAEKPHRIPFSKKGLLTPKTRKEIVENVMKQLYADNHSDEITKHFIESAIHEAVRITVVNCESALAASEAKYEERMEAGRKLLKEKNDLEEKNIELEQRIKEFEEEINIQNMTEKGILLQIDEMKIDYQKRLAEKDKIIKALQDDINKQIGYTGNAYRLGVKDCSEQKDSEIIEAVKAGENSVNAQAQIMLSKKDKSLEAVNRVNKTLNDSLVRLKKELSDYTEGQIKPLVDRQVQQALSDLAKEIEKMEEPWEILIKRREVLKAIDSRRTVEG